MPREEQQAAVGEWLRWPALAAAVGGSGAAAPRAEPALSRERRAPGLLSVRSSAAAWDEGVPPPSRGRVGERPGDGGLPGCALGVLHAKLLAGRSRCVHGLGVKPRDARRDLGRGKHLAARAAAAAASGEAAGERRRPGAHPLRG